MLAPVGPKFSSTWILPVAPSGGGDNVNSITPSIIGPRVAVVVSSGLLEVSIKNLDLRFDVTI